MTPTEPHPPAAPSPADAKLRSAVSILLGWIGKGLGFYLIAQEANNQARVAPMAIYLSLVFGAQFAENVLLKTIEELFSKE